MTADVDLLPCPCGAAAAIHITGVSAGPKEKVVVACVDPECHWSMTGYGAKQAATRWNRRATAAQDAEIEALRAEVERLTGYVQGWEQNYRDEKARAERLAEMLRETTAALRRHFDGTCDGTEVRVGLNARALLRDQEEER